jgi:Protein of unknown function (DUF3169)
LKRLLVYAAIFLYGLQQLVSGFIDQSVEGNTMMMVNLLVVGCLIVARFILHKVEQASLKNVDIELEDQHQLLLERKVYNAITFSQIAVCLSFIALLVGFLLLRDTEPVIALWSWVLSVISFIDLFPSQKIAEITNPTFRFPNPQSKNYNQEVFDQFDDGEKYIMLKGLYKLHTFIIWGLVLLASALMFYSAFTGHSQVISIIGIGILLLLIQVIYTTSLKPNR